MSNTNHAPQQPPPIPEIARRHRTKSQLRALEEEMRVDEAMAESFPASDPPAHSIERTQTSGTH